MPEPVFEQSERVPPPSGEQPINLPKELVAKLEGKTAAQQTALITQYYQGREQQIIQTAREAIRTNNPGGLLGGAQPPNSRVTMERPTTEVPSGELDAARATLRETARRAAQTNKKYWSRFEAQIEAVMSKMAPEQQVDFNYWEAVYFNLLGQNK